MPLTTTTTTTTTGCSPLTGWHGTGPFLQRGELGFLFLVGRSGNPSSNILEYMDSTPHTIMYCANCNCTLLYRITHVHTNGDTTGGLAGN